MLKERVITAVVLLLAFAFALFMASVSVFAVVLFVIVGAAAWEWSRLCGLTVLRSQIFYAALVALLMLFALYLPGDGKLIRWLLLAGFLLWLAAVAAMYLLPKLSPIERPSMPLLLFGVPVMVVTGVSLQYLRSYATDASPWLLLYAFAIIWFMDTGAYFSGRKFGKRKLAPLISPGKTWEGVYGGLLAASLLMVTVWLFSERFDGMAARMFVATLLAAAFSVIGDLFESRIKRAAGMKDSSQLLPGHGGVLDRLDGVLAAMPMFAFVWAWM
ncbi:MAG: phosphatidate cytidylyltransferase [Granulosicoccus sp.]